MTMNLNSNVRMVWKAFGGAVLLLTLSVRAQNLFETDYGSGNILEFTPDGVKSTFASAMDGITGLAFDKAGNLFVATATGSGNIYEFTPGGVKSTFASGLNVAFGLAFDSAGNLLVSHYTSGTNGSIIKITPAGVQSTFASGLTPNAFAFDSSGDLFEANFGSGPFGSGAIYKFSPDGVRTTFATGLVPLDLAFNSAGDLFEADDTGYIYEFAPDGTRTTFFGPGPGGPISLAFDTKGNLFEASAGHVGEITEFSPDGQSTLFATGVGSPQFLAFSGATLPVPEPSVFELLAVGAIALLVRGCRKGHFSRGTHVYEGQLAKSLECTDMSMLEMSPNNLVF